MAHTIASFEKLAREGLYEVIDLHSKRLTSQWKRLVTVINTKQDFEEFHGISDFGLAQVTNELEQVNYDSLRQGFNSKWYPLMRTIGFQVSKQAKVTDQYNKVREPGRKLALALNQTKEFHVAGLFNFGFSTSYLGPDAKSLFATDHPLESGTNSNRLTTDLALDIAAMELMVTELALQKSHRGNPMPVTEGVKLTVPRTLWMLAERLTMSAKLPQSNDNDPNPAGKRMDMSVNDFLSSTTAYFAHTSEASMFLLTRIPMFTEVEYEQDIQGYKTVAGEEYAAGWKDWRGTIASRGA